MKIAKIQFPVFNPYNKPAVELYVSGCKGKCQNCHNSELWSYDIGEDTQTIDIRKWKEKRDFFDAISILGGDLLDQDEHEALNLVCYLSLTFSDKELWLFTGYDKDECPGWIWEIFDYVKVGRYIKHLSNNLRTQYGFLASSNQKLLKKGRDY